MRALMVGDVVGRPGRDALAQLLRPLRDELRVDFVVVNAENAAAGRGLTARLAKELLASGADVLSSGNHIYDVREFVADLEAGVLPVLRPANYPGIAPGRGLFSLGRLTVINLMGRTFMPVQVDDPFRVADRLLDEVPQGNVVLVDFHAEATSEKQALAWYLDGRVAAVVGTHTHVPTADARILPKGTAMVTDVGMAGAVDSIIGDDVDAVLTRFLTSMPTRLPVAAGGDAVMNAVFIDVDDATGLATHIERVDRRCVVRSSSEQ
ncbi:MAG: YmdB family metallophosphoesterase [Dehalococcoidia bacterium]|nr:YmdB family metallophosphoesterase [Dehalococcoidia bacterium]